MKKKKPSLDSISHGWSPVSIIVMKSKACRCQHADVHLCKRKNYYLWSVFLWDGSKFSRKSTLKRKKMGCLEGKMISLIWFKKLWRSCENWPFARGIVENKIWESRDNNWEWNSIDKSFYRSVLCPFLRTVTAVLPNQRPLSAAQPIPKIVSHFLGPSPCSSASHQQCLMTSAIKCPFFPYLFNLTLKNFRHANSYSYVLLQDSQLPCATVPPRMWACSWLLFYHSHCCSIRQSYLCWWFPLALVVI